MSELEAKYGKSRICTKCVAEFNLKKNNKFEQEGDISAKL